jgi:hypothetical protein
VVVQVEMGAAGAAHGTRSAATLSMAALAREVITGCHVCGLHQRPGIATALGYPV